MDSTLNDLNVLAGVLEDQNLICEADAVHGAFLRMASGNPPVREAALGDMNLNKYLAEALKGGIAGGSAAMMTGHPISGGLATGAIGAGMEVAKDIHYQFVNIEKKAILKSKELKKLLDELGEHLESIDPKLGVTIAQYGNVLHNSVITTLPSDLKKLENRYTMNPSAFQDFKTRATMPASDPSHSIYYGEGDDDRGPQAANEPMPTLESIQRNQAADALAMGWPALPTDMDDYKKPVPKNPVLSEVILSSQRLAALDANSVKMLLKWQSQQAKKGLGLLNSGVQSVIPEHIRDFAKDSVKKIGGEFGNEMTKIEPSNLMGNIGALGIGTAADIVLDKTVEKLYEKLATSKFKASQILKEIPTVLAQLKELTLHSPFVTKIADGVKGLIQKAKSAIETFNPKQKDPQDPQDPPQDGPYSGMSYMPTNPMFNQNMYQMAENINILTRVAFLEATAEVIDQLEDDNRMVVADTLHKVFVKMGNTQ